MASPSHDPAPTTNGTLTTPITPTRLPQHQPSSTNAGPQRSRPSRRRRQHAPSHVLMPPKHTDCPALKRGYAIPTPLHSPHVSRRASVAAHGVAADEEKSTTTTAPISWRGRLRHFTWTWFCMTMATGQMANVIAAVPYRFKGLYTIGLVVVLFNIVLFLCNVTLISLRFRLYPGTFWNSMTHPTESLFVPAAVISTGTILLNITQYGVDVHGVGSWLEKTMVVLFWVYCGLAMSCACGIYLIMWSTQTFTISRMTPVWIFPAYPLLVIGPHAYQLAARVASHPRALAIIVGGFTLQGIGFMVSLMVYAAFLYRLMTNKLPTESLRPGMFISVGPSGFTISGVIGLGRELGRVIPPDFMGVGAMAGVVTTVAANWMGIWLWGLAIFFFIVSLGANVSCVGSKKFHFAMTWYSFVFPNTGLTTGTFAVGRALNNKPIQILGCVFAVLIVLTWIFVFGMMIRAVHHKQILWPNKQEDRDEGGWILAREDESGSLMFRTELESVMNLPVASQAPSVAMDGGSASVLVTRASLEKDRNV
ncbi:hypothetical protein ANO11243_020720 [Dothideomycetidae sp. 11243]|nr:hypothetical protein ANO11243_020720 [fungal sp. No.11243]